MTCAFVSGKKIDSYLKLQILLRLRQSAQQGVSLDELAEQFFVADTHGLANVLAELCQQGVLRCAARRYALHDHPDIAYCVECLERTFDDPLARQRLLSEIANRRSSSMS